MVGAVAGLITGFLILVVIPMALAVPVYLISVRGGSPVEGAVFLGALVFMAWDTVMIISVKEAHVR